MMYRKEYNKQFIQTWGVKPTNKPNLIPIYTNNNEQENLEI